jgi:hypothetical protein
VAMANRELGGYGGSRPEFLRGAITRRLPSVVTQAREFRWAVHDAPTMYIDP